MSYERAIELWYDEGKNYNYNSNAMDNAGHFTQVGTWSLRKTFPRRIGRISDECLSDFCNSPFGCPSVERFGKDWMWHCPMLVWPIRGVPLLAGRKLDGELQTKCAASSEECDRMQSVS